jgi:hypothetical protein
LKTDVTQITALTILDKALEFESMTPEKSEWTLEKLKDNPPRLIRLQQLNVLLRLFLPESFNEYEIVSGLDSLLQGQFILLREFSKYDSLFETMDSIITSSKHYPNKPNEWTLDELRHNYTDIIKFKKAINKVLNHNSGIMEISYPYLYSVTLIDQLLKKLDTKNIDEFLSLVIDPLGRTFDKAKLIQEYNYPTEDIYDIDLDWW